MTKAITSILASVALAAPLSLPAVASASYVISQPNQGQVDALVAQLEAALADAESEAEAREIINNITAGQSADVIAAALNQVASSTGLSSQIIAAVNAASTNVQQAIAASNTGTAGTGVTGPTSNPVSGSNTGGAPGGGGGSGYTPTNG